jgi:hypothetical protein
MHLCDIFFAFSSFQHTHTHTHTHRPLKVLNSVGCSKTGSLHLIHVLVIKTLGLRRSIQSYYPPPGNPLLLSQSCAHPLNPSLLVFNIFPQCICLPWCPNISLILRILQPNVLKTPQELLTSLVSTLPFYLTSAFAVLALDLCPSKTTCYVGKSVLYFSAPSSISTLLVPHFLSTQEPLRDQ